VQVLAGGATRGGCPGVNRHVMRLITVLLVAAAGLLAGCTIETTAAKPSGPATVTETVTSVAPAPAGDRSPDADPLPCDAAHVQTVIAPGDGPVRGVWHTEIVVMNVGGPDSCWLDGASELEFFMVDDDVDGGQPLGIDQVTSDFGAGELAVLDVGGQASMSVSYPTAEPGTRPECLAGGAFAQVTMPGDSATVEAWPAIPDTTLPPVCGPVEVTFWVPGGAPGVAPN
jgi:hypothetical protein